MADWRTEYVRHGVCVLRDYLSAEELALLRAECDRLRAATSDDDLQEADCVIEIPPAATLPEGGRARTDGTTSRCPRAPSCRTRSASAARLRARRAPASP